jgi:hypothetical protein
LRRKLRPKTVYEIGPRAKQKSTKALHGKLVRVIRLMFVVIFAAIDIGVTVQKHIAGSENTTRDPCYKTQNPVLPC